MLYERSCLIYEKTKGHSVTGAAPADALVRRMVLRKLKLIRKAFAYLMRN